MATWTDEELDRIGDTTELQLTSVGENGGLAPPDRHFMMPTGWWQRKEAYIPTPNLPIGPRPMSSRRLASLDLHDAERVQDGQECDRAGHRPGPHQVRAPAT